MCNLHSNKMPHEAMRLLFDVTNERANLGNMPALTAIYPKYEAPIVTVCDGERALIRSQWGFLIPNKSKKTDKWIKPTAWNNTRDDKIRSTPLWRDSFERRRCLVPATAYCETTGRNPATFHWFNVKGAEGFALAGIWMHQRGTLGDTDVDSVVHSVVTTSPNALASNYHNRMPVILAAEHYDAWLSGSPDDAFSLLQLFPARQMQVMGEGIGLRQQPT